MEVEKIREKLVRLVKTRPFSPIELALESGKHFVVMAPQQIAFHPEPNATSRFVVLDDERAVSGTLDAVQSIVRVHSPRDLDS